MLNTPDAYREAGHKTATARLQRDESRATFHKNWFTRARSMESTEDRDTARQLFDAGYADAQPSRQPQYFK
jgi:hypothetical protein